MEYSIFWLLLLSISGLLLVVLCYFAEKLYQENVIVTKEYKRNVWIADDYMKGKK